MKLVKEENVKMEKTVLAFGCFDGLHLGHKRIIDSLIENTENEQLSVLLSLDYRSCPNAGDYKLIYTEEEKADLLSDTAVDTMVSFPLNEEICNLSAQEFVESILVVRFGAEVIVAGENISFGKDGEGDIELLEKLSGKNGYKLVRCAVVNDSGREISSEWIRNELTDGDLKTANRLLGHPFTIYGEVVHGKALGRTVGMPTANLQAPEGKLMPKFGVYGSLSEINSVSVMGLTNLGQRPSVDDFNYVTIETFMLDFSSDIYGERIALELHAYIRGVVKFPNLEAVKSQVDKDLIAIRSELERVYTA